MLRKRFLLGVLLASAGGLLLSASLTGVMPLPWRSGGPAAEARTAVLSEGVLGALPVPPGSPLAAVPELVNFQGLLTDPGTGDPVPDGNYSMRFSIWDAASGPTEVWNETQPTVAVAGGLFSVQLGAVTALTKTVFDGDPRYLEVKVGADPAMTPRQRFTTVPYAFFAEEAGLLDGLDSADFWKLGGNAGTTPGTDFLGTNDAQDLSIRTNATERIHIDDATGNVGIGTTDPGAKLEVAGDFIRTIVRAHGVGPVNGLDNGALPSRYLTFDKKRADTGIRVTHTDNKGCRGNNVSCRWQIRFNGSLCTNPGVLAYDLFVSSVGSTNLRLSQTTIGTCFGLPAGTYTVQVYVGATPGVTAGDAYTGWPGTGYWALEAEEVR